MLCCVLSCCHCKRNLLLSHKQSYTHTPFNYSCNCSWQPQRILSLYFFFVLFWFVYLPLECVCVYVCFFTVAWVFFFLFLFVSSWIFHFNFFLAFLGYYYKCFSSVCIVTLVVTQNNKCICAICLFVCLSVCWCFVQRYFYFRNPTAKCNLKTLSYQPSKWYAFYLCIF